MPAVFSTVAVVGFVLGVTLMPPTQASSDAGSSRAPAAAAAASEGEAILEGRFDFFTLPDTLAAQVMWTAGDAEELFDRTLAFVKAGQGTHSGHMVVSALTGHYVRAEGVAQIETEMVLSKDGMRIDQNLDISSPGWRITVGVEGPVGRRRLIGVVSNPSGTPGEAMVVFCQTAVAVK